MVAGHYMSTEALSNSTMTWAQFKAAKFPASMVDVCLQFYFYIYHPGLGDLNVKVLLSSATTTTTTETNKQKTTTSKQSLLLLK